MPRVSSCSRSGWPTPRRRRPPTSGARSPGRGPSRRASGAGQRLADQRAVRVAEQHGHLLQELPLQVVAVQFVGEGHPHRPPDDLLALRAPFGLVAVQQPGRGDPAHRQRQLPRQVPGVLDPGVHALAAGGWVQVRRVAGHEHPPVAVPVHDPVADPEHRRPAQVRRARAGRGQVVERGLDVGEGRFGEFLAEPGRGVLPAGLREEPGRRQRRDPVPGLGRAAGRTPACRPSGRRSRA